MSFFWKGFSGSLSLLISFFSRQICESTTPLHPVLPALIEVFVNSALVPASNRASPDGQTVNEPISEHEIRVVFQNPVFDLPCKTSGQTPIRGHRSSRSRESTPFKGKREYLLVFFFVLWILALNLGLTVKNSCSRIFLKFKRVSWARSGIIW